MTDSTKTDIAEAELIGDVVEKALHEWSSPNPNSDGDHINLSDLMSDEEIEHLIDEVAGDVCHAVRALLVRIRTDQKLKDAGIASSYPPVAGSLPGRDIAQAILDAM